MKKKTPLKILKLRKGEIRYFELGDSVWLCLIDCLKVLGRDKAKATPHASRLYAQKFFAEIDDGRGNLRERELWFVSIDNLRLAGTPAEHSLAANILDMLFSGGTEKKAEADKRGYHQQLAEACREKMVGKTYRHFKGGYYRMLDIAVHSENSELMAVYQSLNTDKTWVRPLAMFLSEVDRTKYPNAGQRMRFEEVDE